MHKAQSLINHVALVLDASWSMRGKESEVVRVTDEQIKHLAATSAKLNQETRVSVYRFGETTIECLIFDMDVARLPSATDLYDVLYENTSLLDAIMKSQHDLETTSQLYGDHAFLTFVLTDGKENTSRKFTAADLKSHIQHAPVNWSLGFLVPNADGVRYMINLGVLNDSIAVWDTQSAKGLVDVSSAIQTATTNFMTSRASGVRGTRSVFSTGTDAVNPTTVRTNLRPLDRSSYKILPVKQTGRIDDFIRDAGYEFNLGMGYYQLTKTEDIQVQKQVVVVDKSNGQAYSGAHARDLLGLPSHTVRVKPTDNPKYDVYVQSTAPNRKLIAGTKLLVK